MVAVVLEFPERVALRRRYSPGEGFSTIQPGGAVTLVGMAVVGRRRFRRGFVAVFLEVFLRVRLMEAGSAWRRGGVVVRAVERAMVGVFAGMSA